MHIPGRRRPRPDPSLVVEVRRGFRVLALVAAVPLATMLAVTVYVLGVLQERVEEYGATMREVRLNHEGMIDQETGLRAWLATGERRFLEPYESGRAVSASAQDRLRSGPTTDPVLMRSLVDVLVLQSAWQQEWAVDAASVEAAALRADQRRLTVLLDDGKRRFDAYRSAYRSAVDRAAALNDGAVADQRLTLQAVIVLDVAIGVLVVGVVGARRRRLTRLVDVPAQRLHSAIQVVGAGGVLDGPRLGVTELDEVSGALARLSQDLRREREKAEQRATDALDLAAKLELVLSTGRVMSGCTDAGAVGAAVVDAAAELSGCRATLWMRNEDGLMSRVASSTGRRPGDEEVELPMGAVVRAGTEGRVVRSEDGTAWPLMSGGAVQGVLHVGRGEHEAPTAPSEALEALALTAGASLQSARLSEVMHRRASTDALTGLRNRHELSRDLETEWSRSGRHGRPMSFCLLDLDHFKRINDSAGHQVGDAWLRLVADTVSGLTRTEDTVYRYGGEEIAILLREATERDAAALAERCRSALEALQGPEAAPSATASFGVAERRPGMLAPEDLIADADRALYMAKAAGRNTVATATALSPLPAVTPLEEGLTLTLP